MSAEYLKDPLFARQPCQDSGLDGAEVADCEGLAFRCYECRSDELAQRVRNVAVADLYHVEVAFLQELACKVDVADVVLREVLHLDEASGPAACPGTVELEESAYASVGSHDLLHGLVFRRAGLVELRADVQYSLHVFVVCGLLYVGQVVFSECVKLEPCAFADPCLELCGAVRVAESCDALCFHVQAGLVDAVYPDGVVYQLEVYLNAGVVDDLVYCVEILFVSCRLKPCKCLVELALHLDVHAAVFLEGLPAFRVVARAHRSVL